MCLCVSTSLYVVEMVRLCNRVDIMTANKFQRSFEPCCAVEGWFIVQGRTHLKVSDHL